MGERTAGGAAPIHMRFQPFHGSTRVPRSRAWVPFIAIVLIAAMAASSAQASLARAAKKGDLEKVEKLIAEGADLDATDSRGNSALYLAASKGHADVVEALAQAGADVDIDNSFGSTPLHVASRYGHVEVIRVLVTYGAHIDSIGRPSNSANLLTDGSAAGMLRRAPSASTPLMKAARSGELEAVQVLIELGAELPAREAVQQAQQKGHKEIAAYITQATRDRRKQGKKPTQFGPPDPIVFTADYGRRVGAVIGMGLLKGGHNIRCEGRACDRRDASGPRFR